MWFIVDRLLRRGRRACYGVFADYLSASFAEKVGLERISATTSGSPTPTFRPAPPGITFAEFASLLSDDVVAVTARPPDKSFAADPVPVLVLKRVSDLLTPFSDAPIQPFADHRPRTRFLQGLIRDADSEEAGPRRGQSVVIQTDIELVSHFQDVGTPGRAYDNL